MQPACPPRQTPAPRAAQLVQAGARMRYDAARAFLKCVAIPRKDFPMSDLNTKHNRAVWFDIPVADLERAAGFYRAVLGVGVTLDSFGGTAFGVIEHDDGNGGCLVLDPAAITAEGGFLVYLNVDGRIHAAAEQVVKHGGRVVQPVHAIGPHGCRAVIVDSEGNRLALHSTGAP